MQDRAEFTKFAGNLTFAPVLAQAYLLYSCKKAEPIIALRTRGGHSYLLSDVFDSFLDPLNLSSILQLV